MYRNIEIIFLACLFSLVSCDKPKNDKTTHFDNSSVKTKKDSGIPVLNVGTFHMGETSDANSTEYDEADEKNKKDILELCQKLSKFNPTIILVETVPERNEILQDFYEKYKRNPDINTPYSDSEVQLVAFEIGRLAGTEKIYGIDHKLSYNYDLSDVASKNNATKYFELRDSLMRIVNSLKTDGNLSQTILDYNTEEMYNFLITINADLLCYANSPENFEGADEAAKYYQRNLRMYANINRLPIDSTDRVFILSGASHAAFFNDFLKRSPIYNLQSLNEYLGK